MGVYVVQEKLTDNMARHCFAVPSLQYLVYITVVRLLTMFMMIKEHVMNTKGM